MANLANLLVTGTARFLNEIKGKISWSNILDAPTIPTVTNTYSATGSDAVSGKAVASALGTLDGTVSGTPGAGKTLTAFSETNGKVSATFGNISITKSQISDFPTIPTVNNATLTIQKNGSTVKTFTANASSNVTANITVPTKTSELTNDSGFITSLPPLPIDGWLGYSSIEGDTIWTDGTEIYYSSYAHQYVLDKATLTWSPKTWTGTGVADLYGKMIWTDGTNIYFSYGSTQCVLNKSTSTWSTKTWKGLTNFYGDTIWTDGTNIYHSNGLNHYVLNKSTSTWSIKTWKGLTEFYGNYIWTDGTNIYHSNGSNHYVLNKSTSTWSTKTWKGLTEFYSSPVWTDGTNTYYSAGLNQYVLDKSTSTWSPKTWTGLTDFYGTFIWTDGTNIYYSDWSKQYVLYNGAWYPMSGKTTEENYVAAVMAGNNIKNLQKGRFTVSVIAGDNQLTNEDGTFIDSGVYNQGNPPSQDQVSKSIYIASGFTSNNDPQCTFVRNGKVLFVHSTYQQGIVVDWYDLTDL